MILDKRSHALVCAGFFWLAAALGAAAQAAQVYPGCAQPGPTGKVWYVDPVNGKSPAAGGLGTQAAPWNDLSGILNGYWGTANVVANVTYPGYSRPLLSSVPFWHVTTANEPGLNPGEIIGKVDVADNTGAPPIQPGDTIELMSGNYGNITIGAYLHQVVNPSFVTVEAAPGQTPVFSTLYIRSTNKWVFNGIKVQSLLGTNNNRQSLVAVGDQGAALPTSNIVLTNMLVSSADPSVYANWTQAEWAANARLGISAKGSDNGANTTCVSIVDSHITANHFGLEVMADNMLVTGNEIDRFGDDGIDYAASNILITKNYIHDPMDWNVGAHMDGMQGYPGRPVPPAKTATFKNVVIDSNRVIRQADPKLPFPTNLQGIDAFDGDWANLSVTNNVVLTSSCWGMFFASVHGGKIVNNTVLDDGSDTGTKNRAGNIMCRPQLAVGDKSHNGLPSNDVTIRNNIASGLSIYNADPNMTMDHNICLTIKGGCTILTFVDGKPRWGVYKPGEYADHNIIERNGAAGMFVSFDPAKLVYDLRLRPGAVAIGAGSSIDAPSVDITGAPRGSSIDAGAYQHSPGK